MSNLLITSDTHFDNLNMFATTTQDGYNSRFIKNLSVYQNILEYAEEYDCSLLHLGDVFNRRLLLPSDVLYKTYELISSYSAVTQYYTTGNHDMFGDSPKNTPLKIFSEMNHVNIITEPTQIYLQPNIHITIIPYGASIIPASNNLPKDAYQIMAMHLGVTDAKIGPREFRLISDISVPQIRDLGYNLNLVGHIHKPQTLADNIIIVGSPYQLSFAETEETKYFYVFDTEDKSLVKHPTNAPQFLVHEVNSGEDLKTIDIKDGNYHRINILTVKITMEDVRQYTDSNVIISFNAQSQRRYDSEIVENSTRTPKQEVAEYYDTLETELEKNRLKGKSLKIIEGV